MEFHVVLILLFVIWQTIFEVFALVVSKIWAWDILNTFLTDYLLFNDIIIGRACIIGNNTGLTKTIFVERFGVVKIEIIHFIWLDIIMWRMQHAELVLMGFRVFFLILRLDTLDIRQGIGRYSTGKWLDSVKLIICPHELRLPKLFATSNLTRPLDIRFKSLPFQFTFGDQYRAEIILFNILSFFLVRALDLVIFVIILATMSWWLHGILIVILAQFRQLALLIIFL